MTMLVRKEAPDVPEAGSAVPSAAVAPADRVLVRSGAGTDAVPPADIVDQWGMQSFPASDPPANW